MLWLDSFTIADSLPAAWLIPTGQSPRTRTERTELRHATTRSVLATQLGVFPDQIKLSNDQTGRLLAFGPDRHVLHVSHGTRDGLVLVAMGYDRIGADVERVGAGAIPFSALHRAEQLWLHQMPADAQELAFAELWAVKEAHGKWAGTGLIDAELHPAMRQPDGGWQIAGSAHVTVRSHVMTVGGQRYALALAGG